MRLGPCFRCHAREGARPDPSLGWKRSRLWSQWGGRFESWFQSGTEWEGQTILFPLTEHPERLNEIIETAGGFAVANYRITERNK